MWTGAVVLPVHDTSAAARPKSRTPPADRDALPSAPLRRRQAAVQGTVGTPVQPLLLPRSAEQQPPVPKLDLRTVEVAKADVNLTPPASTRSPPTAMDKPDRSRQPGQDPPMGRQGLAGASSWSPHWLHHHGEASVSRIRIVGGPWWFSSLRTCAGSCARWWTRWSWFRGHCGTWLMDMRPTLPVATE
jgi:hypothetical protein